MEIFYKIQNIYQNKKLKLSVNKKFN